MNNFPYTKLPNIIVNHVIKTKKLGNSYGALACLLYIIRKTVGYNRPTAVIPHKEFMDECGIGDKHTVISAIDKLQKINLIAVSTQKYAARCKVYMLTLDTYFETYKDEINNVMQEVETIEGDFSNTAIGGETNTQHVKNQHSNSEIYHVKDQHFKVEKPTPYSGDFSHSDVKDQHTIKENNKENIKESKKEITAHSQASVASISLFEQSTEQQNEQTQANTEQQNQPTVENQSTAKNKITPEKPKSKSKKQNGKIILDGDLTFEQTCEIELPDFVDRDTWIEFLKNRIRIGKQIVTMTTINRCLNVLKRQPEYANYILAKASDSDNQGLFNLQYENQFRAAEQYNLENGFNNHIDGNHADNTTTENNEPVRMVNGRAVPKELITVQKAPELPANVKIPETVTATPEQIAEFMKIKEEIGAKFRKQQGWC